MEDMIKIESVAHPGEETVIHRSRVQLVKEATKDKSAFIYSALVMTSPREVWEYVLDKSSYDDLCHKLL